MGQFEGQHDKRDVESEPAVDTRAVAGGARFRRRRGRRHFGRSCRDEDGFTWQATYSTGKKGAAKPSSSIVERIKPPADVQAAIDERMKRGMVFVTTDQPATPETRSGKDFTVMDSEGK